jgi:hypothetical protein
MNVFHCNHCDNLVFFESSQCLKCGRTLAFLPDLRIVGALRREDGLWTFQSSIGSRLYRLCENYSGASVCNWAIPANESGNLCQSCRLTLVVPDLSLANSRAAWFKLEIAKRRLIYTLQGLNCSVKNRSEDPKGLAFQFLADPVGPDAPPVFSGHAEGVITINIAEADDAERERRRLVLHEPYRTLLGHFRHESGHYYWDMLIKDQAGINAFRNLFGDERLDYQKALEDHYSQGAPTDWQEKFVTAYASSHPWEDWAETWAHYLHMIDLVETAAACGLSLRPSRSDEPAMSRGSNAEIPNTSFDWLIDQWFPVTYLLNNLNRGMGLIDGCPFVLSNRAIEKLKLVQETIQTQRSVALISKLRDQLSATF